MPDPGWSPDWAVVPGEVLVEALEERSMTQAELGRRMDRPLKTISEIANGKSAITAETAIQLEHALGISAAIWLGLEARFREAQARARDTASLGGLRDWLHLFPMSDLTRRGVIPAGAHPGEQAASLLRFFGVSSREGWENHWGTAAASFRMSGKGTISPHAVAVWLRLAELEARADLPPFDRNRLTAAADSMRGLSRAHVFAGAVQEAKDTLARVGVGLILMESVRGAPASGAVRWIGKNPWIVLTLRHGFEDQFWFSLYHEIGHLLEGGRRREVVEELPERDLDSQTESAANRYARDALVPADALARWLDDAALQRDSIRAFASQVGVSPGIVVGRLQRDRILNWSELNDLKKRIKP